MNACCRKFRIGLSGIHVVRRIAIISAAVPLISGVAEQAHAARASRAYLVRNDTVTVLKQVPTGWAYVDYVNTSGKHLLRWIKAEQLTIKP
jgi:hypothetical protein